MISSKSALASGDTTRFIPRRGEFRRSAFTSASAFSGNPIASIKRVDAALNLLAEFIDTKLSQPIAFNEQSKCVSNNFARGEVESARQFLLNEAL